MPLIGDSSGMEDCLELARKIGIKHIFYRLDAMFHLGSPMQEMKRITGSNQNQSFIILTRLGEVHTVRESKENEKTQWKSTQLYSEPGTEKQIHSCFQLGETSANKIRLYQIQMDENNQFVVVK